MVFGIGLFIVVFAGAIKMIVLFSDDKRTFSSNLDDAICGISV